MQNIWATSNFGQFFSASFDCWPLTVQVLANGDEKSNDRRCSAVNEENFEKHLALNKKKRYISLHSTLREFLKLVFMRTEFCQVQGSTYVFTYQKSGIWEYQ